MDENDIYDISEIESVCNGCTFQDLREKYGDKLETKRELIAGMHGTRCSVGDKFIAWFGSIEHCCGLNWHEALDRKNRELC